MTFVALTQTEIAYINVILESTNHKILASETLAFVLLASTQENVKLRFTVSLHSK